MEAMQTHYPNRRLVVIFEPHTFSWRNRDTIHWYDSVFRGAHLVLVYEPAIQGSKTHKQLSQAEIVERIQAAGVTAYPTSNKEEALQILERELSEGDVVLISTSGDIGGLVQTIPPWLEQQFPLHEKMG
jgi:UDP-N-acetylmuramate: L-alanyl-gamma-D-glutamyl-meso-diaminopimelate ligase